MSSDDDPPESDPAEDVTAVVLAAGRGQRLGSELPKPLFPICGRPMAAHVLHALFDAGIGRAVVVVPPGGRGELIRSALSDCVTLLDLEFVVQEEPRGTADAVLSARGAVQTPYTFVANGDLPLITQDLVKPVLTPPDADVVVATSVLDDPAEMGRIIRDSDGVLRGIVEYRDADEDTRAIREVNLGLYRFRTEFLWTELRRIVSEAEASVEAYVTDAVPSAVGNGSAHAITVDLPDGRLNVETPSDAAVAESIMRRRIVDGHLASGVYILDRYATWIDADVTICAGARIEPGCHLRGRSSVGANSRIGPNAILEDATIGESCILESCTIRDSKLGSEVEVGPYSTIRPGCVIASHAHIGTHAELKEAAIGERVQIGHFSYVGDAQIGAGTNVGAGAITCNFDGSEKHRTSIGADVFVGSDSLLIAPLRIGDRARTGAGAVVTKDVPDDGAVVGHPARLVSPGRTRRADRRKEAER